MSTHNSVVNFYHGYVASAGNVGANIAGLTGLALKGSTYVAGVCLDPSGNIYITDAVNNIILKITQSGNIINLAGLSGSAGNNGGNAVSCVDARFNHPMGICCDRNGDVYVADTGNNQIRKISNNKVTLVAGDPSATSGTANGVGAAARFNAPNDVTIDRAGNLYVADTNNHAIRIIRGSSVGTMAGLKGTSGNVPVWSDMTTAYGISGADARFNYPCSVVADMNGYIYVCDTENSVIKRIDQSGNVRIFSGSGVFGRVIGTAKVCSYQYLKFSDVDRSGNLYVVDYSESGASRVLRVNPDGVSSIVVDYSGLVGAPYTVSLAHNLSNLIVLESDYPETIFSSSSSSSVDSSSSTSSSDSSNSSSSSENYSSSSSSSSMS